MYVYASVFTAVCKAVVCALYSKYVVCVLFVPAVLHVLCIVSHLCIITRILIGGCLNLV